jgi:hypothetical protein
MREPGEQSKIISFGLVLWLNKNTGQTSGAKLHDHRDSKYEETTPSP